MVIKNLVEKKTKAEIEEENESESESEIEFDYNDDEDDDDDESSEEEDDSDDSETEDSENEKPDTTQTPGRKKGKNSKLKRAAESKDDDANDASNEDEEKIDASTTERPKKKKRKMSKLEKSTDDSEDDETSEEEATEDDGESGEADGDDESEGEEEEEEEEEDEEAKAHTGFANVLSMILSKKTVSTKKVILAQGKTDREIKKLKESKLPPEEQESKEELLTPQELEEKKLKRKLWLEMGKVKPNPLERNREKDLKMIATRGVVQLFNAVKKQQKMVNENLSDAHSERKKDMVIESMNKKSFINLLQNTKVDVSMGTAEKETPVAKEPERKIWSVLKDDFVIGTGKMKDWDKQDDIDVL